MSSQNNNVNVKYKYLNNVNNVKANKVNYIAEKLAVELNDKKSLNYYRKVAWKLSESSIYTNLEQAKTGKNPPAYFTWLCNRLLVDKHLT